MKMLQVGDAAPDFTLANQTGETVTLSGLKGRRIVLYFYPKAMTPGCTTQACGMRDIRAEIDQKNGVILAISPDPVAKLAKFADKYELNFDLLADENHEVCELYGVWQLKKFMGKSYMGVVRSTFILSTEGVIEFVTDNVRTKTHHTDVLNWL